MRKRVLRLQWWLLVGLSLLVVGAAFALTPSPAGAQCGADASSCKQCHEGDAQYPVKELGPWHVDHAADDFCQFCHGGDPDASEPEAAHAGMIAALSDPAGQCATCHPADFDDQAAGYADVLASSDAGGSSAGGDAGFWASDGSGTSDPGATDADAGFWLASDGSAEAQSAPAPVPPQSASAVAVAEATDWKNPLLAGIAGFLTAVSGMTVWSLEGWGEKLRTRRVPNVVGREE